MSETLSKEATQLLYQYFDAAANLYGVIPLRTLLRIYNSQNEPISEEDFVNFVESIYLDIKCYSIFATDELFPNPPKIKTIDKNLVAENLCLGNCDEYFDMIELQKGKPYYIPDKKQLLKYANDGYFEKTLEFISLRAFLRNLPNLEKEEADILADDIQLIISIEKGSLTLAIQRAAQFGLDFDNASIRSEFSKLCNDLCNHTRMNMHCGHTPAELYNI